GTFFTSPVMLSKLLPFVGFAVVIWQGYKAGERVGGRLGGATTAVLLTHCNFLWERMLGANPRGFGFPLVVSFLRYAAEGSAEKTMLTLIAQAAFYPSVVLFCGPAYALTWWRERDLRKWAKLAATALACGVLLGITAYAAQRRVGSPI